jgi:hypothetical protein
MMKLELLNKARQKKTRNPPRFTINFVATSAQGTRTTASQAYENCAVVVRGVITKVPFSLLLLSTEDLILT